MPPKLVLSAPPEEEVAGPMSQEIALGIIKSQPERTAMLIKKWLLEESLEERKKLYLKLDIKMAKIDPTKLTGPQKAAIFLMLIGEEFTSEVYKYLDEEDIKRIGIEMAKIDYIPSKAVRKILEEANIEAKEMLGDLSVTPEEFLKQSLLKAYGEKGKELYEEIKKEIGPETFKKLRKLDPKTIASFLSNEHPQTLAIILAHLDPDLSGQVLQLLPEKMRGEVLLRIALLNKVDPEIVKEISDALEAELQSVGGALGKKLGGLEKAVEVLSRAERELEDELLTEIEDENPTSRRNKKISLYL